MKRTMFALMTIAIILAACAPAVPPTPTPVGQVNSYQCQNYLNATTILDPSGVLDSSAICQAGKNWYNRNIKLVILLSDQEFDSAKDWDSYLLNAEKPQLTYSFFGEKQQLTQYAVIGASSDGKYITVHFGTNGPLPNDAQAKMRTAIRDSIKNGKPTNGFLAAVDLAVPIVLAVTPTPTPRPTQTPEPTRTPTITPTPAPTPIPDPEATQKFLGIVFGLGLIIILVLLIFGLGPWGLRRAQKVVTARAAHRQAQSTLTNLQYKIGNLLKALEWFFQNKELKARVAENTKVFASYEAASQKTNACKAVFESLENSTNPLQERITEANNCLVAILGSKRNYMTVDEFKQALDFNEPFVESSDDLVRRLHTSANRLSNRAPQPETADPVTGILDHILEIRSAMSTNKPKHT